MIRCTRLRLTGSSSARLAKAAIIRVSSVGLALDTSTIRPAYQRLLPAPRYGWSGDRPVERPLGHLQDSPQSR